MGFNVCEILKQWVHNGVNFCYNLPRFCSNLPTDSTIYIHEKCKLSESITAISGYISYYDLRRFCSNDLIVKIRHKNECHVLFTNWTIVHQIYNTYKPKSPDHISNVFNQSAPSSYRIKHFIAKVKYFLNKGLRYRKIKQSRKHCPLVWYANGWAMMKINAGLWMKIWNL